MSFVSERTLEYTIIPKIQQTLKLEYSLVIPIYFWTTREGNSISKELNHQEKFRVLAVYLRRPKIFGSKIYFKVNNSIIALSPLFEENNIPVLCTFPLASKFIDLDNENLTYHSLKLKDFSQETTFSFSTTNKIISISINDHIHPLTNLEIYELINHSKLHEWNELSRIFRIIKQGVSFEGSWFYSRFFGGYQPVYFLISE